MPTPIPTHMHFGSLIGMSKDDISFDHSDSFTSSFVVTMLIMTIDTMSIEKQLAEMVPDINKLTKTIEEKDLQITSLMSKVET